MRVTTDVRFINLFVSAISDFFKTVLSDYVVRPFTVEILAEKIKQTMERAQAAS